MTPECSQPGCQPGSVENNIIRITQQEQENGWEHNQAARKQVFEQGEARIRQQEQTCDQDQRPVSHDQVHQVDFEPFAPEPPPIEHDFFLIGVEAYFSL
jgi:hypothetical protein